MSRPRVFLDISLGNEPAGRVIFELNDNVPKTTEKSVSLQSTAGFTLKVQSPASGRCAQAKEGFRRPLKNHYTIRTANSIVL
jgi:hypothetical protein